MSLPLRRQPAWIQLVIFGLITLGFTVISSLVGVFLLARALHMPYTDLAALKPSDFALPQYAPVARGLLVIQFLGIFLLPSLIFARICDRRPLAFCGLKKPVPLKALWLGPIIVVIAYLMVDWLASLNEWIVHHLLAAGARQWIEQGEGQVDATLQNLLDMKTPWDLLVAITMVGVMAALGEELFFRGILQRILIQALKSPWGGILLTGAIFSAIHGQFMGFIPRMALGVILGAIYWYSGSLLPAILGHFFFNTAQILLIYYKVIDSSPSNHSGIWLQWMGLVALVVVVLLIRSLQRSSQTRFLDVYPPPGLQEGSPF